MNKIKEYLKKSKKTLTFAISCFLILRVKTVYAADEDPLSVVNNLSNFIFDIVQAVGVLMVLFGIVQFGLALKSHDPSQRASSIFTILGGIIIACSKVILNTIMK